MDLRKNIMMIVSLMVAVIIALSVLVPVIQDTSASEDTFTNEGYYTMDLMTSSSTKTIRWEIATPNILTIDGEDFDTNTFAGSGRSYTVIGSDTVFIRYSASTSRTLFQAFGADNSYNAYSTSDTMTYAEVTISGGTIAIASDKSGYESASYSIGTECYAISLDGDYAVMKKTDESAYVLGDSPIRFMGITGTSGAASFGTYGVGTIDDGMTLSTMYVGSNYTTITFSDPVATKTAVSGYEDLYLLEKYTFTADIDGTEDDVTYSYFLVPYEVTAERSVHVSTVEASLLNIIPLLVVIGIVMGAVWFIRQKN